jgi:hypothetical protein
LSSTATSWPSRRATSFTHQLARAFDTAQVRPFCLGIGVDPLTFATDILTVVTIEAPLYDELFGGIADTNTEGSITPAVPFTAQTVKRYANTESTAALDHLTAPREHARSIPAIASWLATIEATIRTDRGDHAAACDALDRARTALNQVAGRSAPASFHYHGTAQLTAATGRVLLLVGDYDQACEVLTAAVADPCLTRAGNAC